MTRLTTKNLPDFYKQTIGFDRLFDEMEKAFTNTTGGYPPYNIAVINENEYMISIACAGFGMDNLEITQDGNSLTVTGTTPPGGENVEYLHKGIATRNFTREFKLAQHVEVEGAHLEHGMLNIHLKRNVPDELLPRRIEIK